MTCAAKPAARTLRLAILALLLSAALLSACSAPNGGASTPAAPPGTAAAPAPSPSATPSSAAEAPTSTSVRATPTAIAAVEAVSTATPALEISPSVAPTATRRAEITSTAAPAPSETAAIEVIVDDRDPGFSFTGAWFTGDGGASYDGGCHWAPPGIGNIAYVKPELPLAGSYDLYAWGCGDPNHDQVWQTEVMVYSYGLGFVYAVPNADVALKEDAGRWAPVGTFYMQPNSSLSIGSQFWGNVAVDAFRFVYRSPEQVFSTPQPAPTAIPWTNHPPSPQEQLTAGDLAIRLGLVQNGYQYSPAASIEAMTFDDCAAFPREGCGGSTDGWQVRVDYLGREPFSVAYRVSQDLALVSLDAPDALRGRQSVYLCGKNGAREFCVYRYPDQSWVWASRNTVDGAASSGPLDAELAATLAALAGEYASIGTGTQRIVTADGWELRLYGLGAKASLDQDNRARFLALGSELGARAVP